jgi:anti-anti-sigma factor
MPLLKHEVQGEVRFIIIQEVRLVDDETLQQLHKEILEVIEKTEEPNVLLHFGRVGFMSSAALGILIRVSKKCKEFKIAMTLCNIAPNIREVFKITGLEKVFEIYDQPADALEAIKKSGKSLFRK